MAHVRVTPSGIMDKDTELSYVGGGNYIDANDIRHRQADGNNFTGIMPIKGNALKNTIGGYTSGQKRYRFYVDISDLVSGELASHDAQLTISFVYSGSGAIPATYSGPVTYAGTSISGIVSTIQSSITSLVSLAGTPTFSVAPPGGYTGNTAYFDMYWSGQDFTVVVESTQGTYAKVYLLDEYLTVSGNFNVVGSEQIDDDLFLFLASDTMVGNYSLVSEIGVLYSTDNDSTFTYTRLIRSKKLGFSKNRRIESQSEKTTDQISFYLTDDQSKPRVVYLKYANKRVADGLLFPQGGRYELDNIDTETALFFPASSSYFDNIEVIDNAGSLKAGNKRYTGRFLSEDLVSGDFLYPTNPINIFNVELNKPHLITGNTSNTITAKSVRLTLKNIPINIYKYFELVAIEYAGESFTAKIVQRFNIPLDTAELTLEHTDRGQENIQLGPNELVSITQKYIAAKTIRIFDNRMTLSNLVEQSDLDLSAWAKSFKHEIKRTTIQSIGKVQTLSSAEINYSLNEYINPNNVNKFTSYMLNDTYRFGVQVQWKNTGKWSSPYWVDDVRIDKSSTNWNASDNRRVSGTPSFSDINLTDSTSENVYIYYVNFSNISLDATVNGLPIKSQINAIRFVRSERIPEVIATGYFISGAKATSNEVVPFFPSNDIFGVKDTFPISNINKGLENEEGLVNYVTNTDYSDYLFFYSPDLYFNKNGSSYEKQVNDTLKISGIPTPYSQYVGRVASGTKYYSTFAEDTGYYGSTSSFSSHAIDIHRFIDAGNYEIMTGSTRVWTGLRTPLEQAACREANVFKLPSKIFSTLGGNGIYYGQIFRDLGSGKKYPVSKELSVYQSTGHLYVLSSSNTGLINLNVFGGDVFNQKTNMLLRMGQPVDSVAQGAGVVYSIYSQNVLNTQMFFYEEWDNTDTGTGYAFPQYLDKQYSGKSSLSGSTSSVTITSVSGTIVNVNTISGLYVNQTVKVNGSLIETGSGTNFNGQILKIASVGPGSYIELKSTVTLSWSSSSATLSLSNMTDVLPNTIGSGLFAYAQQKLSLSNNNTYEKSYDFRDGTIVEQGFDTNKDVISDLPTRITWSAKKILNSPVDNYRIFKPIDFADLDLTFGEISHHETINNTFYTFQEKSFQRQYFRDASLVGAQEGTDVVVGSGSILGAPGVELTAIGTSKKWSVIKGKTPQGKDAVYWYNDRSQKIMRFGQDGVRVLSDKGLFSYLLNNGKYVSNEQHPLTGKGIHGIWNDRYSEAIFTFKYNTSDKFTLVYDEIKNGFICFHSYYPNIFLSYNNTFFSPNPSSPNTLWLHDSGSECSYYGTAVDPTIEMVMNYEPNATKIFEAIQVSCEKAPASLSLARSVFFNTKNHSSFLDASDLELREDFYYSTIKNHEVTPGVNDADTSRLWGRWLKIKFNLKNLTGGQKLINLITKFRLSPRLYNQ